MIRLNVHQVESMHQSLIREFGGEMGVLDPGALERAVLSPFQTFSGIDLYNSLEEKCAALIRGLIQNHPFVDGNKRTGMLAGLALLTLNTRRYVTTSQEVERVGLAVASGGMDRIALTDWVHEIQSRNRLQ